MNIRELDKLDNHNPIIGLDLKRATLRSPVRTSAHWDRERALQPGTVVLITPAINLPADSRIKWWLLRVEGNSDCGIVSDCEGPYGVGLYADDVEFNA